ncbi:hypothetical protein CRYUN_Cryun03dG0149500 [Craigia yunnanensis]
MGTHSRPPSYLVFSVVALSFLSLTAFLIYKVPFLYHFILISELSQRQGIFFPPKNFTEETRQARAYKIIQCSYLTCRYAITNDDALSLEEQLRERRCVVLSQTPEKCPNFFKFIYRDLEPWAKTQLSNYHIMQAKQHAAFRSRLMFTIWGLLQLLKRYPGMVPDEDMMFDCMDKPTIDRIDRGSFPVPLFRYCTTEAHFDIPFPDWSFWGWPEINIEPWDEQFKDIKQGSQAQIWTKKFPRAFWKGNPDVEAPIRQELMQCNHSRLWGAQIIRQAEEAKGGFEQSKLYNQCNHRYKIYAEGYAWSVSLKYILSCGSLALLISPQYEDFFTHGLIPKFNYWPVSPIGLCHSIKFAVVWGNTNPLEAEAIGKRGQQLMESLSMDRVYDYKFHLISEYSKLQDFKPVPPSSAQEVCEESLLCLAKPKQREFLRRAAAGGSSTPPCNLIKRPNSNFFNIWTDQKKKIIEQVKDMEMRNAVRYDVECLQLSSRRSLTPPAAAAVSRTGRRLTCTGTYVVYCRSHIQHSIRTHVPSRTRSINIASSTASPDLTDTSNC